MRQLLTKKAFFAGFVIASMAFAKDKYEAGKYNIDGMHSKVGFEVTHLVISSVEGVFTKYEGAIQLDKDFSKSKVEVKIDADSISTQVGKRDEHLKSADFFDVAKYPKLTFESTEIKGSPEKFKLIGNLTIKDKTKKVTFDAKYLGLVKDGYGQQKAMFEAKTEISRKEFGLTWNDLVEAGPAVGDKVRINLKIQSALEVAKK
jgi:polyisoprenoid-binding protein YceI